MRKKFDASQMSLFGDFGDAVLEQVPVTVSEKSALLQAVEEVYQPARPQRELFRLLDEHLESLNSVRSKIAANIQAIELLQTAGQHTEQEKASLVAYSGWGGLSDVFAKNTKYPYKQEKLKKLLDAKAFESAKDSVLSAYYTEPHVIRSIWSMLKTMGFTGGRVLEPSCGVGHFIGAMPDDLRRASHISMVEIDDTTAAIARAVYADSQTLVFHTGLENAPIASESFDLVVGNVPFGNYRVSDRRFDHLRLHIHDYFFAKCMDALRPGGVMCLITSTGTMDKMDSRLRPYLSERADLVTAIRLPTGAFNRLGGTDVVADILVFQKRQFGAKPAIEFQTVGKPPRSMLGDCPALYTINEFFVSNPSQVLGNLANSSCRFGVRVGVNAVQNWPQVLDSLCADRRLQKRFDPACNVVIGTNRITRDLTGIKGAVACGYFFAEDGQLVLLDESSQVQTLNHLPGGTVSRLEGMTRIRNATLELLEADSKQCASAEGKRQTLNRLYDAFVKHHGFLLGTHNRRLFASDSHAPLLWSLELYDEEKEAAVKADIFVRPTVSQAVLAEHAETMEEAIALSYNKYAKFNPDFVAKALGRGVDEVLDELVAQDRVYLDPSSLQWQDSESYLSGEVYEKLDVARAAQNGDVRFERNVRALQAVVPTRIALREVAVRLGVPWIGAELVEAFVQETMLVASREIEITHLMAAASWAVNGSVGKFLAVNTKWGTTRRKFSALLEDLLNQRQTEVHDAVPTDDGKTKLVLNANETLAARAMAEKIQTAFVAWIFASDERVATLEDSYNRLYNGRVNRHYDGSHLVIPGLNPAVQLRAAQKDSIWRGLVSGNTLYALAVGGGKTLIQICVAHESKRLGIANKPMLVVPNHMLEAFAGEYLRAFPRARVLAASKDDLVGGRRRSLLMRAATNDWDCIIITHSSFGKLAVGTKAVDEFIKDTSSRLAAAIAGATNTNAVRDASRQKKQLEAKLKSLSDDSAKDSGVLNFEQLGTDMLCVDEADLFKNLWFHTKKTRVSGLSTTCSGRALDLFLKSRLIFERRKFDGFGLMFATATPIANTIAEMFIMQTYLHPWTLRDKGLDSFDAWAANFAREVTSIEVKPEGSGYRMHTRFAQFVNVPELMLLFREVAEIRTKKDLALPEPRLSGGGHTVVAMPASQEQKAFVQTLVARADAIRQGNVKPSEDNMLCVTNDGRKAALDMRCIDPRAHDNPASKVNACVAKVVEHWQAGREQRLTQLVFCDLSTPSNSVFSVYHDIRKKLIDSGIPEQEIAFAQDYSTDKAKAELHRKVRQGMVRVLIGSTELMGFGTNVQDRLVAKHDLDAPWRPRDVEQRDGRIIRQCNQNEVVNIYRYVTEQTFDAYSWQTLERKAGFIAQVMGQSGSARSVEDVTTQALSFAEVKALASGNPLVIEKAAVDAQVARLLALKSVYLAEKRTYSHQLHYARESVQTHTQIATSIASDLEVIGDTHVVSVNGSNFKDLSQAGKAIMQQMAYASAKAKAGLHRMAIFKLGTASVEIEDYGHKQWKVRVSGMAYEIRLPYGAENIAQALREKTVEAQLRAMRQASLDRIESSKQVIATLEVRQEVPFEHESVLTHALNRKAEIDDDLAIDAQDETLMAVEED